MSGRLRIALRELTDFPATTTIGALWILVYAAMAWHQGTPHASPDWLRGGIQTATTHKFGDLTSRELYAGQVWRTVTATFVHYSLLHLGLNLISLYQLGRVVEDWYGSWRFVALYVVLGGVGNALAGLVRPWGPSITGAPWITPSGGGSTAVFGLVTLLGVGAWRSKTRFGDYAKGVVLALLLLNGVIAYVLRKYMDHYGHAGGALVGAVVGLAHPALSRDPEGRSARWAGWAGVVLLIACAASQAWADRIEVRARSRLLAQEALVQQRLVARSALDQLYVFCKERAHQGSLPPPTTLYMPQGAASPIGPSRASLPIGVLSPSQLRKAIRTTLAGLDATKGDLDAGPTAEPYRRMRTLAERAVGRPPTPGQYRAFHESWLVVRRRAEAEVGDAVAGLNALQSPPPVGAR